MESPSIPTWARNAVASEPQTSLNAASEAAPHGPASTPISASTSAERATAVSLVTRAASSPDAMIGHARLEMVPQFRPAIEVTPVVTLTGRPAARLAYTQAAFSGSTDTTAVRA